MYHNLIVGIHFIKFTVPEIVPGVILEFYLVGVKNRSLRTGLNILAVQNSSNIVWRKSLDLFFHQSHSL